MAWVDLRLLPGSRYPSHNGHHGRKESQTKSRAEPCAGKGLYRVGGTASLSERLPHSSRIAYGRPAKTRRHDADPCDHNGGLYDVQCGHVVGQSQKKKKIIGQTRSPASDDQFYRRARLGPFTSEHAYYGEYERRRLRNADFVCDHKRRDNACGACNLRRRYDKRGRQFEKQRIIRAILFAEFKFVSMNVGT